MKTLTLKNKFQTNATLLPNDFIDNYMVDANGEFVKVYLFLLRHLDDPCSSLTLTMIADCLNNTEADILRAFRYWEKKGLLRTERDADGKITALELQKMSLSGGEAASAPKTGLSARTAPSVSASSSAQPAAVSPAAPSTDAASASLCASRASKAVPIDSFRAQKEIKSLLFIAEQYLGKTLTHTEMETITYFYDTLHMSADLIEYLIESCVENGHKSMHYIRKVAFSWVEEGIETVSQAKEQSALYNKNCYTVLNAFGIKNRGPASSELAYIRKWAEEYAFSPDIIAEACRRTITATHQPSFEYADSILTKWHGKNIRHLKDITALDEEYQKERTAGKAAPRARAAARNLNNFERRSYDMESLEEQLLNSN
ncbi:MAG TPA: DnaD domain protein [Candidatus Mediterraneibacter tabaqchaliae]|uniref:DnaD domain protein n=1 Tax=Candidatus Mediterraneibacter tabaqchaliae TaxID=2838689 RepID=A0A9D2U363_9FIRM|nr:DnaD domain protein [Candidatus Mediterraneibacter tabaqchaliae]